MLFSIDTCQNKVSADQYYVTIVELSLELIKFMCVFEVVVLVFDWIAGSCQVTCNML